MNGIDSENVCIWMLSIYDSHLFGHYQLGRQIHLVCEQIVLYIPVKMGKYEIYIVGVKHLVWLGIQTKWKIEMKNERINFFLPHNDHRNLLEIVHWNQFSNGWPEESYDVDI